MGLLEKASRRRGCAGRRLWDYFMDDVREDLLLEAELMLLSFATGIQDAAVWVDYALFASNQTGNTLFLAIASAGYAPGFKNVPNIATSLGTFVGGALLFGQLGNYVGPRKRWWLILSNVFQTVTVYAAAIVQYTVRRNPTSASARGVITLLAVSSGAQVGMGRSLRITEITTAMATSVFVDAVVDPDLLRLRNRRRNRRIIFLVNLTAGCFAGAWALRGVNSPFALLLCAIVKSIATAAFFFNKCISKDGAVCAGYGMEDTG
jgi:uncharacterized membrane protein YoaK (UPF0700 family)